MEKKKEENTWEKEIHLLAEKENTSDRLLSFRPKNDQNAMVVPNKFK